MNANDQPVNPEAKNQDLNDTENSFAVKTITIKSSVPTERDFRLGSFADSEKPNEFDANRRKLLATNRGIDDLKRLET